MEAVLTGEPETQAAGLSSAGELTATAWLAPLPWVGCRVLRGRPPQGGQPQAAGQRPHHS